VRLEALIKRTGTLRYAFDAKARHANLTGTKNPVPVMLTIGDDSGATSVKARISHSGEETHGGHRRQQLETRASGRDPVRLNRITRQCPPADVAAVESAQPINDIDRRIGARPDCHNGVYGTVAIGGARRHDRLQVSVNGRILLSAPPASA
jgi:hypothetical protein